MLYVRENIPAKILAAENASLEGLYIELNLKNRVKPVLTTTL